MLRPDIQAIADQDTTVELLTVVHPGGSLHLTNSVRDPSTSVVFGGISYLARQFKMEQIEISAGGALPRPTLELDNIDGLFTPLVVTYNDLKGSSITYTEVFRENLDDGDNPSTSNIISQATYNVFQMSDFVPSENVKFVLAAPLDAERAVLGRQALPDVCPRSYRVPLSSPDTFKSGRCPYAGNTYYNTEGEEVTDWREDVCGKTLEQCKLRFGLETALPFQGFPGIGRR